MPVLNLTIKNYKILIRKNNNLGQNKLLFRKGIIEGVKR